FPRRCWIVHGFYDLPPDDKVFAVGNSATNQVSRKAYRFLALGDPSVFINGMMVANDSGGPADNLKFADRVITFLASEGDSVQRKQCIFIQNGALVTKFDDLQSIMRPPPPPIPMPNIDKLQ